jgi:uncharacterized cysteine cluster protein YcgN (CxxCxxCC family)
MAPAQHQFWQTKSLDQMTKAEWESLCDRCGRCCLHRVQNGKTGKVKLLAVACQHFDPSTCRCRVYPNRFHTEPDCLKLSPDNIRRLKKLPYTCAYRCLVEGRELAWWHPLVSGDPATVHEAGISVQDKVLAAMLINPDDLQYFPDER